MNQRQGGAGRGPLAMKIMVVGQDTRAAFLRLAQVAGRVADTLHRTRALGELAARQRREKRARMNKEAWAVGEATNEKQGSAGRELLGGDSG